MVIGYRLWVIEVLYRLLPVSYCLLPKISNCVRKDILHFVAFNVLVKVMPLPFTVTHLAEDQAVVGDDALDGIEGAVGVVLGIHAHVAVFVAILEGHLTVLKELFGKLLRHHELAFAVADGNLVDIAFGEGSKPRGVGAAHAGAHDARDVAVDVVTVKGGGVGRDLAELAKRQQTRLDERLEAIADTKHQALTVE